MSTRKPRKARLQLEVLERRENPSAIGGGLHVFQTPAHQAMIFKGTGRSTVAQETVLPGGGLQVTSSLYGLANLLGQYNGVVNSAITIVSKQIRTDSTAIFVAANGDQLDISFSGAYRAYKPNATRTTGSFAFIVTGGTGAFASATGRGGLSSTIDLKTGDVGFSINGRVTK